METTQSPKSCPFCGASLSNGASHGLCPRCLLIHASLPTATEETQSTSATQPPSVEDVRRAFPHLEILDWIGRGGMGCVYKVRQPQLDRIVALKILPEELGEDGAFAERFAREARALAALNHPNIVTVHDFGRANGFFYLLMEFVDGVNLRQALQAGRFSPKEALAVVPPLCDAIQYAHDCGIVHRDIKPENILLDRQGVVKVADFGIARMLAGSARRQDEAAKNAADNTAVDPDAPSDEHAGVRTGPSALGTPGYMAPEQAQAAKEADHRVDIYSLGVVFYELLTGEPPSRDPIPPSRRVEVDVRLDAVVLRALAEEPRRRYQHASEFKTAVQCATGESLGGAAAAPPRVHVDRRHQALQSLRALAMALKITGGVTFVLMAVLFFTGRSHPNEMGKWGFFSITSGLMVLGACRMRAGAGLPWALMGAIAGVVTGYLNWVCLPISIWALMVLAREEVKWVLQHPSGSKPERKGNRSNWSGPVWSGIWVAVSATLSLMVFRLQQGGITVLSKFAEGGVVIVSRSARFPGSDGDNWMAVWIHDVHPAVFGGVLGVITALAILLLSRRRSQ